MQSTYIKIKQCEIFMSYFKIIRLYRLSKITKLSFMTACLKIQISLVEYCEYGMRLWYQGSKKVCTYCYIELTPCQIYSHTTAWLTTSIAFFYLLLINY